MDPSLDLLGQIPAAGDGGYGGGGLASVGSVLTMSNNKVNNNNNHNMSSEISSSFPDDDESGSGGSGGVGGGGGLELGLRLCIGGGLKTKDESPRILTGKDFPSCSSSSSSSVNIPSSSIVGTKRASVDSVSPPNSTSVVGWPPIRKAHRKRAVNTNRTHGYLSVKVNMDGTLIGRKVDLNSHSSYEMLAQTLEDMFHESLGSSRLLNGTSEFLLTYEDKDGDCMLVGDVPWPMFLSSVKRLRILKNSKLNGSHEQWFP